MARTPTFFQYEKCQSCVKAHRWLDSHGVTVNARPVATQPPTVEELRDLWKRSGLPLKRFFNTSGNSYRALPNRETLESRPDDEKLKLLAADGMLVKRPILDDGKTVLVGFDEEAYAAWASR